MAWNSLNHLVYFFFFPPNEAFLGRALDASGWALSPEKPGYD